MKSVLAYKVQMEVLHLDIAVMRMRRTIMIKSLSAEHLILTASAVVLKQGMENSRILLNYRLDN